MTLVAHAQDETGNLCPEVTTSQDEVLIFCPNLEAIGYGMAIVAAWINIKGAQPFLNSKRLKFDWKQHIVVLLTIILFIAATAHLSAVLTRNWMGLMVNHLSPDSYFDSVKTAENTVAVVSQITVLVFADLAAFFRVLTVYPVKPISNKRVKGVVLLLWTVTFSCWLGTFVSGVSWIIEDQKQHKAGNIACIGHVFPSIYQDVRLKKLNLICLGFSLATTLISTMSISLRLLKSDEGIREVMKTAIYSGFWYSLCNLLYLFLFVFNKPEHMVFSSLLVPVALATFSVIHHSAQKSGRMSDNESRRHQALVGAHSIEDTEI